MSSEADVVSPASVMSREADILSQVWCHVSLILGLLGNTYVLYATIYHKAIKLDKLSVWIIQNLAVADIANLVLILIPAMVTLYAGNEWILGDTFCEVMFVYKYVGAVANVVLINVLSLNKMLRCLFPLRNITCSRRQRLLVTSVTVISSLILPIYSYFGVRVERFLIVEFSPSQCMCWSVFSPQAKTWHHILGYSLAILLNALPCVTLCIMNAFLVFYALAKSTRAVNKMNIVIVVLVTGTFLVPLLPYFLYYMIYGNAWDNHDGLVRFVTLIMFISSWANPPIYLITNKSFKVFTANLVRRNKVKNLSDSNAVAMRRLQVLRMSTRPTFVKNNLRISQIMAVPKSQLNE